MKHIQKLRKLILTLGILAGMSMTAQAATTLTDTFTTNTGATEYTGDYSKVSGYVWIGATNKALALTDPNTFGTTKYGGPITIETLNGEIIDKVVLSGVSNPQNAYVHPSSGNVTNTLKSGDCCYNLNDDGAIEIENINSTTVTISFHPGYGGTCFYANVVVYCHEVPVDITGVELNKTSTALTVGETDTLTATVNPDNSDHTVAWSSDNESVATVSDGVVTAVAEGTATITVTATNGTDDTSDDKTATCAVTVETPVDPISYITAKADPYNTGAYYATFYDSTTSYVADCEVYYATANAGGRFTLEKAEGNVIKAGEGVILKAIGETVTLTKTTTEASYDSLLTGSNTETTVENALVLSLGKNGVWFYKYSGTLGANKAYLAQ